MIISFYFAVVAHALLEPDIIPLPLTSSSLSSMPPFLTTFRNTRHYFMVLVVIVALESAFALATRVTSGCSSGRDGMVLAAALATAWAVMTATTRRKHHRKSTLAGQTGTPIFHDDIVKNRYFVKNWDSRIPIFHEIPITS